MVRSADTSLRSLCCDRHENCGLGSRGLRMRFAAADVHALSWVGAHRQQRHVVAHAWVPPLAPLQSNRHHAVRTLPQALLTRMASMFTPSPSKYAPH